MLILIFATIALDNTKVDLAVNSQGVKNRRIAPRQKPPFHQRAEASPAERQSISAINADRAELARGFRHLGVHAKAISYFRQLIDLREDIAIAAESV